MNIFFIAFTILEAFIFTSTCSLDAFTASFAYGSKKIKISPLSNLIVNLICSSILGISLILGTVIRQYLPSWLTLVVCFAVLFIMGLMKLLDSITKSIIRKHTQINKEIKKEIKFSLLNFNFILSLYANPENADVDTDKIISPAEAIALAVSLSLDGIAVGFGAALGNMNVPVVFIMSFITGTVAIASGCWLGGKLARTLPFNVSWISGAILILLAISKLF